ncbi:MAG: hypothetical protein G8345_04990 [Magnetococcales bacterium]|nr:hypothetical protein [Magnetococcales bacterium]NGZ26227.1 hypothetical protein [Magnetococcales bacterium]
MDSVSYQTALERARVEYEKYHTRKLMEPSPVEEHFQEVLQQVKQLEKGRPGVASLRGKGVVKL